jgi:tRNA threonylcarbamoyladenosine biosynthesis protein TsaB
LPPKPFVVLAFDTSAAHCAAALLSGDHADTSVELMSIGQAERLAPMLEQLLTTAKMTWADIDLIVVGTGPGNFTGIRIGVALARGLALGLGIPAVGVTGFEVLGETADAAIPAPRGQVYLKRPGHPPELADAPSPTARLLSDMDLHAFVTELARVGRGKAGTPQPRPAPFYLRPADAAPASDRPPVMLS